MEWTRVDFSVDLIESTLNYLRFLDSADDLEKVLTGPALRHAICRYEQLWCLFAIEFEARDIAPPIDIEWVWHMHMLSPVAYQHDCRKLFKGILDHSFKDSDSIIPCINHTIEKWYQKYPKEGFNIIRNGEYVVPKRNVGHVKLDKSSTFSAFMQQRTDSLMHFCYQVSLPHFRDRKYLESALMRYKQFLYLKKNSMDEFLTPSVDIMLIWYAHMCCPRAYAKDMMSIFGQLLDNDIKVKPAKLIDHSFLQAKERTDNLWKSMSPDPLHRPGTKLRALCDNKEMQQMTFDDLAMCCVVVYSLQFTQVNVVGLPPKLKRFELVFYLDNAEDGDPYVETLRLRGPRKVWTYSKKILYNASYHTDMRIVLKGKQKMFCWQSEDDIAAGAIDMEKQILVKRDEYEIECDLLLKTLEEANSHEAGDERLQVKIEYSFDSADVQICFLILNSDTFQESTRNYANMPVPVRTQGQERIKSYVAKHRYIKSNQQPCLQCEIIHVPELLFSQVRILTNQRKLVATANLIGSSQLPSPSQVQGHDLTMAFDPELGERAMLIRNHKGDWGIVVGRWVTENEKQGYLEIRFMKLAGRNKVQRLEVRDVDIEFQSFNANLYNGKIQINPSQNTIGENLATFWSIAILHVLCAPHDPGRCLLVTLAVTKSEDESAGEIHKYVKEEDCLVLKAAGLLSNTPTNQYILEKFGSLTFDLQLDAQNVMFVKETVNHKLLRKESKKLSGEFNTPVRKLKKKKKSKLGDEVKYGNFPINDNKESPKTHTETVENARADDQTNKMPLVQEQKKIFRRHRSSNMDDLLLSDDSIKEDDVAETKFVKDDTGKIKMVKKISSGLQVDIPQSDDSVDKDIAEDQNFLKGKEDLDILEVSREQTTLIKEIVKKKKRNHLNSITKEQSDSTAEYQAPDKSGVSPEEIIKETSTEDNRSDTSSTTTETKKMRLERISRTREALYPLTDEDADGKNEKKMRKRKKSLIKRQRVSEDDSKNGGQLD